MMILRFFAVDGFDSYSPVRARQNRVEPLGKTRDADGKWIPDTEPARVVLDGDELVEDRQFLRKEIGRGHLLVADEETATQLEVPWKPESIADRFAAQLLDEAGTPVGPPAAALADAIAEPIALPVLAKHADTLPPPAFETPDVTPSAPTKRKEK